MTNVSEILSQELECKKQYLAKFDCKCYWCSQEIAEGEPLWFFGIEKKTCEECFDEIEEAIENI